VKPDTYYNILKYTQKYGAKEAAAFSKFEASHVYEVKNLVEKEQIDCDFVLTRSLDVYLNEEHAKATKESYDELKRIGACDSSDVQFLQGEAAQQVSLLYPEIGAAMLIENRHLESKMPSLLSHSPQLIYGPTSSSCNSSAGW
jgi:hypothetical protein